MHSIFSPAARRQKLWQKTKSGRRDGQVTRLTDKGIGEVQKIADFLRPMKFAVDTVWHSGKARAQQTGELLAEAVGARNRVVQREGLGPKDQVATTKEALEQTGGDVMIVGHLPFLGKLVSLLVTGSEKNEIVEFHFGSVVCIERAATTENGKSPGGPDQRFFKTDVDFSNTLSAAQVSSGLQIGLYYPFGLYADFALAISSFLTVCVSKQ